MSMATMMMMQAAGRRRDERGRYMGDDGGRMEMRGDQGNNQYTRERRNAMPESNYNRDRPDMRRSEMRRSMDEPDRHSPHSESGYSRRSGMESPDMGGEGWVVWDTHQPIYRSEGGESPRSAMEDNITDMREYGRRHYPQGNMGGQRKQEQRKIGYTNTREDKEEHLTREQAEEWAEMLRWRDDRDQKLHKGPKWSWEEIQRYASNYGIKPAELPEFWAVVNAMYADYCNVARKFGQDKVDFYAELAKAFIHDPDAQPGKVKSYFDEIVKGDDD